MEVEGRDLYRRVEALDSKEVVGGRFRLFGLWLGAKVGGSARMTKADSEPQRYGGEKQRCSDL